MGFLLRRGIENPLLRGLKLWNQTPEAKGRLILLNSADHLLLHGAQRLFLSQSVNEFDGEVALGLNIL